MIVSFSEFTAFMMYGFYDVWDFCTVLYSSKGLLLCSRRKQKASFEQHKGELIYKLLNFGVNYAFFLLKNVIPIYKYYWSLPVA